MRFSYIATVTATGAQQQGFIDAQNVDLAVAALQRRSLVVLDIRSTDKPPFLNLPFLARVPMKEIVILSRQLSTLFEAKVSVLASFQLLADEAENYLLRQTLNGIADDMQGGSVLSQALAKHPKVFSDFYVNMIRSGEESGKLPETFTYLAEYLERQYELVSKARNALIYPAFVLVAFFAVMILMLVFVIPQISGILKEYGQELPFYTKIVIAISDFFVHFGIYLLIAILFGVVGLWRYLMTEGGKQHISRLKLSTPIVGNLYRKLYLSRISDNLETLITSGVSMLKAIEVTANVVDDEHYKAILLEAADSVRGGSSLSAALGKYEDIPSILTQMMRIGEETGKLGFVLGTVARFYKRELENAVNSLVALIEPAMIIILGVGVGILLVSVLMPIYNIAGSIS
jgi:type IV pilus assembly protein PilC